MRCARRLGRRVGSHQEAFAADWGMWSFYTVRGKHRLAGAVAQAMLDRAEREGLRDLRLTALRSLGSNWLYQGQFKRAYRAFSDAAMKTDEHASSGVVDLSGQISEVNSRAYLGLVTWFLGDAPSARIHAQEAHRLALNQAHPYSIAFALACQGILHYLERDPHGVLQSCQVAVELSRERGFPFWLAAGQIMVGWGSGSQCEVESGLALAREGLESWGRLGAELVLPTYLTMVGELELHSGDFTEAEATLRRALDHVDRTGKRSRLPRPGGIWPQWHESPRTRIEPTVSSSLPTISPSS